MAEKGFWPLYEGKHIEQFLVDIKPIERWVSLEACRYKYGKPPEPGPKLVFRDIASNTNERTCIAAVLPERSCANNKLPVVPTPAVAADIASSVLNSLAFDFVIRFRVSSTMNFTHVSRAAVPHVSDVRALPIARSRSVVAESITHVSELRDLWPAVWLSNRAVAEAYGLGPDDFEHILSTFPVFTRKRPAFFAYLRERLAEWKKEAAGRDTLARYLEAPALRALRVAEGPETERSGC
jgi:hypothetical protein